MIAKFKIKTTLTGAKKLNKHNWFLVEAVSSIADRSHFGNKIIDQEKEKHGAYYEKWELKKEAEGYIFREINHNCGISGHHKTYKAAILTALKLKHISVYIPDLPF